LLSIFFSFHFVPLLCALHDLQRTLTECIQRGPYITHHQKGYPWVEYWSSFNSSLTKAVMIRHISFTLTYEQFLYSKLLTSCHGGPTLICYSLSKGICPNNLIKKHPLEMLYYTLISFLFYSVNVTVHISLWIFFIFFLRITYSKTDETLLHLSNVTRVW